FAGGTNNYTTIPIGPYAPTGSAGGKLEWVAHGNASWSTVTQLIFSFYLNDGGPSGHVFISGSIDGLHFTSIRYDIAQDQTSINKYGLREEFITDPLIKDSGSAALFAKAELFKFRVPIVRGTVKSRFYPTMHPGQLVTVVYPDGNINQDFRILNVAHDLSGQGFYTRCEIDSDTGSMTPLSRSKVIDYIIQGTGLTSRSVNDLLN